MNFRSTALPVSFTTRCSPLKREPLPFSVERGKLRLVDKTYTDTHNESQDSGRQLDFPSPILMCVAPCLNWPKFGWLPALSAPFSSAEPAGLRQFF